MWVLQNAMGLTLGSARQHFARGLQSCYFCEHLFIVFILLIAQSNISLYVIHIPSICYTTPDSKFQTISSAAAFFVKATVGCSLVPKISIGNEMNSTNEPLTDMASCQKTNYGMTSP